MTHAVNEIQMLAQKAARGAGAHPAQAVHFGRAAVCHLAAGRPVTALTDALDALPAGPIQTLPFAAEETPLGASYEEACAPVLTRSGVPARVVLPEELLAVLSALAHRTYVPATEASRVSGAGARACGALWGSAPDPGIFLTKGSR